MAVPTKWTLVQHSGYGYAGKPGFKQGLEERRVDGARAQATVVKEGGVLLDTYGEAHDLAFKLMYPGDDVTGMYPRFRGTFSHMEVDGLKVAVPLRQVVA